MAGFNRSIQQKTFLQIILSRPEMSFWPCGVVTLTASHGFWEVSAMEWLQILDGNVSVFQKIYEHFNGNPWTNPEFNDNHWAQAVAGFSNRGESPVGKVLGINDDVLWISTAEDNPRLFSRRNLSDDATLPLTSIQDISSGMSEYIW